MIRRRGLMSATGTPSNALYWLGDECTAKTGGWVDGYVANTNSYWMGTNKVGTLRKDDEKLVFGAGWQYNFQPNKSHVGSICTHPAQMIDLTDVKSVNVSCLDYYSDNTGINQNFYVAINPSDTFSSLTKYVRVRPPANGVFTLDVENYVGEYYILIMLTNESSGGTTVSVDKVWLE